MTLKINEEQSLRVHALARDECCNCYEDNCLLLDDGEQQKCVQLISVYGIYCKYFLNAVLPLDRELYTQIIRQNKTN